MALTTTASAVKTTTNIDVDGLIRRINRCITEITKSQSSSLSQTAQFDVERWSSYTNMLRRYIDQIVAQPLLDFPETAPMTIDLVSAPEIEVMENESAYDVVVLLDLARMELANSQSSRMASNLVSFDLKRLVSYLDRIDNFITQFISVVEPIDLPESSPMTVMTGTGKVGV